MKLIGAKERESLNLRKKKKKNLEQRRTLNAAAVFLAFFDLEAACSNASLADSPMTKQWKQ